MDNRVSITRRRAKTLASTAIFTNQRLTNDEGAWATLRFDPEGGYRPGHGPTGLYFVEHYSPDFLTDVPGHSVPTADRRRAEKFVRQWLAERPLCEAELAEFVAMLANHSS